MRTWVCPTVACWYWSITKILSELLMRTNASIYCFVCPGRMHFKICTQTQIFFVLAKECCFHVSWWLDRKSTFRICKRHVFLPYRLSSHHHSRLGGSTTRLLFNSEDLPRGEDSWIGFKGSQYSPRGVLSRGGGSTAASPNLANGTVVGSGCSR